MTTVTTTVEPETQRLPALDQPQEGKLSPNRRNSITFTQSIVDWWSSPSELTRPSSISSASSASTATTTSTLPSSSPSSRLRNHKIEYDLYRAIFSDDIYIVPPGEMIIDDQELKGYPYVAQILDIDIGDGNFIHEFYLQNNLEDKSKDVSEQHTEIVIVHGYMAASGYFLKNYEQLLKSKPGIRIHAIDNLGFGNSSRPKFPNELLTTLSGHEEQIKQTLDVESWFIDTLEKWRLKRELWHFKLIAHSMGAYLMSCYLMKYNRNAREQGNIVDEFLVVSPMGTEPNYQSLLNEEKYQYNHHALGGDPFKELTANQKKMQAAPSGPEANSLSEKIWNDLGRPRFPKVYILRKLWEWNKSPFQVLQLFGPFYSKLLSYWSFQRFGNLIENNTPRTDSASPSETPSTPTDNSDLILKLHYYSFSIFNQYQGSGELAITKLINHEILAKLPLSDRGFVEYLAEHDIKTCWMYGDKDWMNRNGGEYIHKKITKIKPGLSDFQVVERAGHHIYLDNPEEFNRICTQFFELN